MSGGLSGGHFSNARNRSKTPGKGATGHETDKSLCWEIVMILVAYTKTGQTGHHRTSPPCPDMSATGLTTPKTDNKRETPFRGFPCPGRWPGKFDVSGRKNECFGGASWINDHGCRMPLVRESLRAQNGWRASEALILTRLQERLSQGSSQGAQKMGGVGGGPPAFACSRDEVRDVFPSAVWAETECALEMLPLGKP
jgi:hypothetical protein